MKRSTPSIAAALALLAVPASSAAAQTQRGAVLRVDRGHRRVEIVDAQHAVRSYAVPRRVLRKLGAGAKVTFQTSGGRISSLRANGRTRKLSFYAKVVSKASGAAVFRLGDGKDLRLQARRHHAHRGSAQINMQGLQPGQVVLVTETIDRAGNVTIAITLVPNANPNGGDRDVTGTITAIDASSVTIRTDSGQSMTFQASSDVLDGFEVDDQVDVTYYAEPDGTFVADDIEPVDDGSADDGGDDLDAIGTVSALAPDSITIQVDGAGPMTFAADTDVTDGIGVGDHVDVSYYQDDDGSLVADDVELTDDE